MVPLNCSISGEKKKKQRKYICAGIANDSRLLGAWCIQVGNMTGINTGGETIFGRSAKIHISPGYNKNLPTGTKNLFLVLVGNIH